ncbi:MAG: formylmethanofuran dehydrogenase subunit E family protein [Candidatus Omnitrophica bacterium]|nr:formylmethanofuran dehydrogenase subunit E family protein [Candidatus Omnitrophota bacterium]MBL7210571.1 formylmethanofuran dehydrogenase subunit E family protein [Candidatus Omnitrophota bacterium]
MGSKKITLKAGIDFHGHLGPWLVLGILAGQTALDKLGCAKYFGLQVKAWGVIHKPKSCLIDGLQLSTGATYGKGSIEKLNSPSVKVEVRSHKRNKKVVFTLKQGLLQKLEKLNTHAESETLAKRIFKSNPSEIFCIKLSNP